jgi:RNA polymerase subunit RPABC4/transcription elongation factor Spt4
MDLDSGATLMQQFGLEAFSPLLNVPINVPFRAIPVTDFPACSSSALVPLSHGPLVSSGSQAVTTARTAGGRKRRRMLTRDTILCPLGCSEPFTSEDAVLTHVEAIHIQRGGVAPDDGWLSAMGRRMCAGCRRLMGRSSAHCPGCRRGMLAALPQGEGATGTPLTAPEPPFTPGISAVLADRRGVLEHVPRGCRASVSQALGRVLSNFNTLKTWESLRDLLGFGKAVLAAPKRGGHRRLPALEREIILRANAIGCSPFEDVWARSQAPSRPPGPKSKIPPGRQIQKALMRFRTHRCPVSAR